MPAIPSKSSPAFRSSTQSTTTFGVKRQQLQQQQQQQPMATQSSSSSLFTEQMRDRQARGKDPGYQSDYLTDGSDISERESGRSGHGAGSGNKLRLEGGGVEKEDFGKSERRLQAIAFLDSPELLMMYAQSTGDSIPAARLHFTKMLCGYDDEPSKDSRKAPTMSPRRDTDKRRGGDRASYR